MKVKEAWLSCVYWTFAVSVVLGADTPVPSLDKPGWKLIFHDEFERPQLNDMYWFSAYRAGRKE